MLVTLKEILDIAEERKIAVGSFNGASLEAIEGVIAAAEELDVPVILQHAEGHERLISMDVVGPIMLEHAKRAKVPVCVHVDHGFHFEMLEKALKMGFSSIMFDGSTLPYEENLALTKKAVALAKEYGASVEAELGSMGRRETGAEDSKAGLNDETKIYTDPEQAAEFVKETGIDALACSFGTTHGFYKAEPKLDFDVVKGVRELTGGIPVVMHGGSGVSHEDYRKSVEAGVRKINYFTYMDLAGGRAVQKYINELPEGKLPNFSGAMAAAREAMKEDTKAAMKVFAGI